MRNFKSSMFAMALASSLGAGAMLPQTAFADQTDYYSLIRQYDDTPEVQVTIAHQLVDRFTGVVDFYSNFINQIEDVQGGSAEFQDLVALRDHFQNLNNLIVRCL